MFDSVAKLAIQGSSEANDENLNVIERARRAHSRVTLIIDEAMRGLGRVNEQMFVGGVLIGGSSDTAHDDQL